MMAPEESDQIAALQTSAAEDLACILELQDKITQLEEEIRTLRDDPPREQRGSG